MKILLTTLNAKYIHKNLALRWLYVARDKCFDVDIKEYTIKEDIEIISNEIIASDYDVIAFSTYIWNIEPIMEIVKKVKGACDKHIILGGPEVTFESFHLVEEGVDALSLGEGELSFWNYIKMLDRHEEKVIEGIYTKVFPNTKVMKVSLKQHEVWENPYFLSMDEVDMSKRYFYLETSRGCPYACEYCLSSTDNKVRLFSDEYVFSILEKLSKSNVKIVKLLDRTFNVYPTRALKMARYMNEYCTNQIFQFEVVAETLSEEMLTFFCEEADKKRFRLEIGIQSFNPKTLCSVARIQNNERLIEVLVRLSEAGIVMHTDLIAGLPYEGLEGFKMSFNRLYDLHTSEIQLGILKLLKGTRLKQKRDDYDYVYNETPPYDVVSTRWMSEEELIAMNDCAVAVEKYYNSGRAKIAIDTILNLSLYTDAFSLFYDLGKAMQTLKKPYQPWNLFALLKALVKDKEEELVDGILNYDYYALFKQKPKMYLKDKLNNDIRKRISEEFLSKGIINEYEMYHYTHIDTIYYKNRLGIQVILYSNKQTYPKRWYYEEERIEEIV